MNGILLVDKDANMTSRDVVNIVSKCLKTKKVGHNGTLDPFATGVLVICVGKYTKYTEILTACDKVYEARVVLGITTDTLDYTGKVTSKKVTNISKEKIEESLKEMTKTYMQEVPIYSAVKINGKKLYEYAREKKEVILPKREVTIKKLELISDIEYKDNLTIFSIRCEVSKGTYIRSLVRDIAENLGTFGMLSSLRRTKQGIFDISDTIKIDDIKKGNFKFIDDSMIFKNYYTVVVDSYLENKIKNGSILENRYNENIILFKNKDNINLALYKTYEKDNTKIKPWKML